MRQNFKTIRLSALAATATLAMACPSIASAQGTSAQDDGNTGAATDQADSVSALGGDIIVTAQRRPERLQDVPVAVTAFNEDTISAFDMNDALRVSQYVPSMIASNNLGLATANSYFLRGLGNSQSVATFDAPVGTYVDNVYVARQNANNYQFFDVDRVEVLRGPQGTLFGRNTTGGAVSVIMKKPSDRYGSKFEMTVGSYDRVTAKAVLDAPVSDTVLTKLAGFYVYDGGYLHNTRNGETLNGARNYGVRGDVRLLPSDAFTVDLSGEYTRNTGTYLGVTGLPFASEKFQTSTTPDFYNNAGALDKGSCAGTPADNLLATERGSCSLTDSYATTLRMQYDTDAGSLEGIFGYRNMVQAYINQYNASPGPIYRGYVLADKIWNDQISGEIKWTGSAFDDRLNYVAGVFYLREGNQLDTTAFAGGTDSFNLINNTQFDQTVETAAGYLQGDYEIIDDLTLTLGARYTYEKKSIEFFDSERYPGLGFNTDDLIAAGIPTSLTKKRVTPRVAISYEFDPNFLVYASATNGFKSGGWNGQSPVPSRVLPFRPEITWSYEGGIKSELFGRTLRLNLNGYYARTKDLQVTSGLIPPGETTVVSLARNAGDLVAYGLEFETTFAPTRNLNIFANGSFNHGEYTSTVYVPGVPDALQITDALDPVRVPDFQIATGATYTLPVDALDGDFKLTGSWRHNSPYFVATLNTAAAPTENFVDLKLGYENFDGTWGASFGVTNLTKQETITGNFLSLFPGDPRRFTGSFWFNF